MTKIAYQIDQGPREKIEDTAAALTITASAPQRKEITLLVVCDGVGGHSRGEVASNMAARHITRVMAPLLVGMATSEAGGCDGSNIPRVLEYLLCTTNKGILRAAAADPKLDGMATTVVCAVIVGHILHVAWAGDSRAYLCRDGVVAQLTEDHSEVAELIRVGVITPEEAKFHPLAHVITNNLGRDDFQPAVRSLRIQPGDIILLCTDGFSDVVSERQIADLIHLYREEQLSFDRLPEQLVQAALQLDTQDNVTVVCCEYQPDSVRTSARHKTRTAAYAVERAEACRTLFQEQTHV